MAVIRRLRLSRSLVEGHTRPQQRSHEAVLDANASGRSFTMTLCDFLLYVADPEQTLFKHPISDSL